MKSLARDGVWPGVLPGVDVLAKDCGVSPETMRQGLRILELEGVLQAPGPGKPRKIIEGKLTAKSTGRVLRFGMLARERMEFQEAGYRKAMENVQSAIFGMGHRFFMLPKTQRELGYDFKRIQRMVRAAEADCWVVESGDEETLRCFHALGQPVFGIGGNYPRIPGMPGVGSPLNPVIQAIFARLARLGHRRIVMLIETAMHDYHRTAPLGFCAILENAGITPGPYNLPDWEETPEGLQTLLESLFRVSPPTAIIVMYPGWMNGVLSFMARRGLKTPDDVSLVCGCHEPTFDWLRPPMAHFKHGDEAVEKAVLEWVRRVTQRKPYTKRTKVAVELVEGGTLGPARKG